MFRFVVIILLCWTGSVFPAVAITRPLYVEDELDLSHGYGPIRCHARMDFAVQEDSNINLRSDNKKSDEIFLLKPDVGFRFLSGGGFDAGVRYRMDIERFSEHTAFNNRNRFIDADAHFRRERYAVAVTDRFENTNDRTSVSFTDLVKREDNTLSAEGQLFFDVLTVAIDGTKFKRAYEEQFDVLRYTQKSVRPSATLAIGNHVQGIAEVSGSDYDYPGEPVRSGSAGHQQAGFVYESGNGFQIRCRGGFQQRQFDGAQFSDVDRLISDFEIYYQPKGRTTLFVRGESNVEEAIVDANNGWYRNLLATAGIERRVTNLTTLKASFYVSRQRYPNLSQELQLADRRRDVVWYGQTAITRRLGRRVQLYMDFAYTKRRSNVVLREYVQKRTSLGIKVEI